MKKILGLDLGTNSVGWALINHDSSKRIGNFVNGDSRIFKETIDKEKKVPTNKRRGTCRGQRKLTQRRKFRKQELYGILKNNGLLPNSDTEIQELITSNAPTLNPYFLRHKGLHEKLELFQLGRILCHINKRRGFRSNRKNGKPKENSKILNEISEIQQQIDNSDYKTLGEYLYFQPVKRRIHTARKMYADEIELLWEKQASYYPDILKKSLMYECKEAIIEQRPLRMKKHLIGKCIFHKNRQRAAKAFLETQEFMMWQNINNMTIFFPDKFGSRELDQTEKEKIFRILDNQKTSKFSKLKKELGFPDNAKFNLESETRSELKGNLTNKAFSNALSAKVWKSFTDKQRTQLVEDFHTIHTLESLEKRLKNHWKFSPEIIEKIFVIELQPGYLHLSRKAINSLLPFMRQGYKYNEACEKAGYKHSEIEYTPAESEHILKDLRNPVVAKAARQAIRLTKSIIRNHGNIDEIVIEMPREMKLTKKQKERIGKTQKKNSDKKEHAKKMIKEEFGKESPLNSQITKYLLWEECGKVCPYTGKTIEIKQLYSQDIDVEHIIPWSISMDNSYMNKTLCFADENRNVKKNMTPFQAYKNNPKKWDEIKRRIVKLPSRKRKYFLMEEIDKDKFTNRQLNDTGYICNTVKKYFEANGFKTRVSKGELTALLRKKWKLNLIINDVNEKNRKDHRHHCIDALVIACTTQSMLQKMSKLSSNMEKGIFFNSRLINIPEPWNGFYKEAEEIISKAVISHQPTRGIIGSLHHDTAYGYHAQKSKGKAYFSRKVPVSDFLKSSSKISKICDNAVKQLVIKYVEKVNKASKEEKDLIELLHKDGKTPINSVRIAEVRTTSSLHAFKDNKGKAYKFYAYQNNHHVEIIRLPSGEQIGKWVTMIEAARRIRCDKKGMVQFDHPEGEFIMWLCANDMVEIEVEGVNKIYRVQKLDPNNNRIYFRMHYASTLENKAEEFITSPNKLRCRKLYVDMLGNTQDFKDGKNS